MLLCERKKRKFIICMCAFILLYLYRQKQLQLRLARLKMRLFGCQWKEVLFIKIKWHVKYCKYLINEHIAIAMKILFFLVFSLSLSLCDWRETLKIWLCKCKWDEMKTWKFFFSIVACIWINKRIGQFLN